MSRKVINVVTGGNMSGLNINIPYAGENVTIDLSTAENVEYILGMDLPTFFEKAKKIDYCVFNLVGEEDEVEEIRESFLSQQMTRSANSIVINCQSMVFTFNVSILKQNDIFTTALLLAASTEE